MLIGNPSATADGTDLLQVLSWTFEAKPIVVRLREKPNLLMQVHEIKVIPRLDNLSIGDPDDCHAGKLDWRLSRASSQEVSFVFTTHGATRSDFITFSNHVLDNDYHIWEGFAERCVKRSKVLRTSNRVCRIVR